MGEGRPRAQSSKEGPDRVGKSVGIGCRRFERTHKTPDFNEATAWRGEQGAI